MQEIEVTVKRGYSPSLIHVRRGMPVRIVFDRRESSDCSARVAFPDFGVARSLPAFGEATVEFTPEQAGRFGFAFDEPSTQTRVSCGRGLAAGDTPAGAQLTVYRSDS